MKVAIALQARKKVFDEDSLKLEDKITIVNSDFFTYFLWTQATVE